MHHDGMTLKRSLSRLLLTFYGLGTILGAGIYVLIGKVGGYAGIYTPLAFLLAAFIAMFTAISYAELSVRFPKSAGEAYYVQEAFDRRYITLLVGWLVIFTGLISAAAIVRGFVGYLQVFLTIPTPLGIIFVISGIGIIAIWGMRTSAWLIFVITSIEIAGLLFVIMLAHDTWLHPYKALKALPALDNTQDSLSVFLGAFIAFYAFIGFEDMVNVAEEVKQPEKDLPFAIFMALGLATMLYVLVAIAMLVTVPQADLAGAQAPLAIFFQQKGFSPNLISLISLIAIINGALTQVIMASRVLYGLGKQGNAPSFLSKVHPYTRTPIIATVFVSLIVLGLALWFDVEVLAGVTSGIILIVFILIQLALIRIKRQPTQPKPPHSYSIWFPIIGVVLSIMFLAVLFI